jgi:hypothetical protein
VDLWNIEVDGSLANPYAAGAVAIWTVMLSIRLSLLVRSIRRSGRTATKATLFAGAILLTDLAQFIIGNLLYRATDPGISSVGFWGGPPIWIAPAVSCAAAIATWVWSGTAEG